jgi:hypothetical protein
LEKFGKYLDRKGVRVVIRRSRGKDIDAACGQLAAKNKEEWIWLAQIFIWNMNFFSNMVGKFDISCILIK